MHNIFSNTLPIFLITLLGVIIKKKWLTSEEFWRGLEKLSYFLLFPAVLFNYIASADLSSSELLRLVIGLIISTSIVACMLIIYQRRNNIDKGQFTSIFQGSIRYNNYIFFGLTQAIFGVESMAITAVVSSYMIVFTNIISLVMFASLIGDQQLTERKPTLILLGKFIFTNPLILASIAGFIFNYSRFELNHGIKGTISTLAASALAVGMLNVGAGLKFTMSASVLKLVLLSSFVKLIALPIVIMIVLTLLSITGVTKSIGILYGCLPCASTSYVLARQLGGDHEAMAAIITFSTIFSLVSLTFLLYILC